MKLLLKIFLLCLNLILVSSQVTQEWLQIYNGTGDSIDYGYCIAVDNSGNVYVSGSSCGNGTSLDFTTIKYNSVGIQQWVARYNGPSNGNDAAHSIAIDDSGNVYVSGNSNGIETGSDYITIKYNNIGLLQWISTYNGPGNYHDFAYSLTIDDSGNVYVTGGSYDSELNMDYATIKYNSIGIQQWVSRYNEIGNGDDSANKIAVDDMGNVYVTGSSGGNGSGTNYSTIKYNSLGVQQWVMIYNGPGNYYDNAYSLAVDDSGNVFVTGASHGNGTNGDYTTIKYNSSGLQKWIARYNGFENGHDVAYSLAIDKNNNIYVTGFSQGSGTNIDYATIKYNSTGIQQWATRYNGTSNMNDFARSIAVDGLGNVYVTGNSEGIGTYEDFATIKYNSIGVQQWVERYNGISNMNDFAQSIAVDGLGNVYVIGTSEGISTYEDYITIKYSQQIGIKKYSKNIPLAFFLHQNYPNPFNPVTTIRFDVPIDSRLRGNDKVRLIVYNSLGQIIETQSIASLQPGTYEYEFDGSNFPSGIYYYQLSAGDYRETKKMILIK